MTAAIAAYDELPEPPAEPSDDSFLAPHYFPSLCQLCKSGDTSVLKRCASCKLIRYCGAEHQKEHWPLHKEFCQAVKKTGLFVEPGTIYRKDAVLTNICRLEQCLQRPLYVDELEMMQFQEHCNLCLNLKADRFVYCDCCFVTAYCNESHKLKDGTHLGWCFELGLCRLSYIHGIRWYADISRSNQSSLTESMLSYLQALGVYPEAVESYKSKTVTTAGQEDLVHFLNLSERLSYPLSFAHSVQALGTTPRERLLIHVVGAEAYIDTLNLRVWSVISGPMAGIAIHLDIYFIGASLLFEENYRIVQDGLTIVFHIIPSLYETFCGSQSYVKPDVVICYNCGIHEKGPWMPAVKYLLPDRGVPLILTSYTLEECFQDVATVRGEYSDKINVKGPMVNPFASLRPYRNWSGDAATPHNGLVFSHNAAIAMLELP